MPRLHRGSSLFELPVRMNLPSAAHATSGDGELMQLAGGGQRRPPSVLLPAAQIVVQATSLCNLDCAYCYLPDRRVDKRLNPAYLVL
jgi:sulfatase maturation enzyme AslB (radical SAM superfamily)